MLTVAFDLFDTNNDKKVSQLDVFKVIHNFNMSPIND
jgi:hypothetical protein